MALLTDEHKKKLDEAAAYQRFKVSEFSRILNELLLSYREVAIREIEAEAKLASQMEGVRKLHAVNGVIRHIESEIEHKIEGQVEDVAAELGIDLDDLRIRRDIDG